MQVPTWLRSPVAWVLAALIAAGAVVTFVDDVGPGPNPPRHRTVTIHIGKTIAVDNADADAKANDVVELSPPAQAIANDFVEDPADLHGALRGPDSGPIAKLLPPFASDEIPGCRTRFLKTNWSYRSVPQSGVVLFWVHFAGDNDRPGTRAEVDGLTAYGNQASAGVSWHFNMDKDGNCDYNVPLRSKAWTESGANSTGISIEVHGHGDAPYVRAGGVKQLRRILDAVHKRYPKIRVVLGGVSNCRPTKGGIVTHWMGGACSGGHTDIKPLDLVAVVRQLQAAGKPARTKHDVWVAHRRQVHEAYQRDCTTHTQRSGKRCGELRSRGRALDRLIARR
jgi:hypothetical protein